MKVFAYCSPRYPLRCIEMPRKKILQVFWDDVCNFFTPAPPGVCVQCHCSLSEVMGGVTAELRGGMVLNFCSQHCAHDYWTDYKRSCQSTSGRRVCGLPGCNKPCYQEGHKTHDYCGRTHAREHKDMKEAMGRNRPKWCSGGGATHRTSPGLLSRFKNGPVKFYNRGEPYYEFTNFYEAVVVIDEQHWSTTEHYFQAQKFVGTPIVDKIRMLPQPRDAFDTSRDPRYSRWRRKDWEEVKEDVMYKALQAKFTQSDELKQLLMETGERKLIEHSSRDSYWGDGGDGSGKNRLGELLMRLRKELRAKAGKKSVSVPSSPTAPREQKMYEEHKHSESRVTGFNRSNSSFDRSNSSDWPTHNSPHNVFSSSVDPSRHSCGNQHTEQSLEEKHSHSTNEKNPSITSSDAQTPITNASSSNVSFPIAMGSGGSQSSSQTCDGQIMPTPSVSHENPFDLLNSPVKDRPLYSRVTAEGRKTPNEPGILTSQQSLPYTQAQMQSQMQPGSQIGPNLQMQPQQIQPPQMQPPQMQPNQMQPHQMQPPQMQPHQMQSHQMQPPQMQPPQMCQLFVQPQMHMQPVVQQQEQPQMQQLQPQMQPYKQTQIQPQTQSQLHSQMQPNFQMQPNVQMLQSSLAQRNPQMQPTMHPQLLSNGSQPHSYGSTTFFSPGSIMTPQSPTLGMSTGSVTSLQQQSSQHYNQHPSQPSAAASSSLPKARSSSWEMPMEH